MVAPALGQLNQGQMVRCAAAAPASQVRNVCLMVASGSHTQWAGTDGFRLCQTPEFVLPLVITIGRRYRAGSIRW
jgi:hypothetical protein